MKLSWTAHLRADLAPTEPKESSVVPERAWTKVRTSIARTVFEKGLTQQGAAVDAMKAGIALLEKKELPEDASAEALGAVLVMAQQRGVAPNFLGALEKTRSGDVVLHALVHAHALTCVHKYPASWMVAQSSAVPIGWRALREYVLREGEDKLLAIAKRAWKHAPLSLKVVFSYAFSSAHAWAAETAAEIAALPAGTRIIAAPVLATLKDATHLEGLLAHRMGSHPLVDVVENLGEDALPALIGAWELPKIGDRVHLANATSVYVDDRAAAVLARELDKVSTAEIARAYFHRHPDIAARALDGKSRSKLGAIASEVLAGAKRTLEKPDEIPMKDLPMVLSNPPWTSDEKHRKALAVDVVAPPRAETIKTSEKRRAAVANQVAFAQFPELGGDALADFVAKVKSGELGLAWWHDRSRVPKDVLLELIKTLGYQKRTPFSFPFVAAGFFGDVVVPPLVDWAVENWTSIAPSLDGYAMRDTVLEIDSHRFAGAMVALIETGRSRGLAWRYFDLHPEATIAGVIPIALSRMSKRRRAGESVLRRLAIKHGDAIRAVAKSHGERAASAIEEILSFDGRWDCPSSAPKMPIEWRPKTFTRPLAKDGRALPLEAVEHIGHMLAFSDEDAPYIGLDDVRAACEPRSLAELAWDAARAWERARARNVSKWMLESIALLGDDEVIRRTTPAIKRQEVVAVLGRAATDAAATELCTLAWRIKEQKARTWRARHWGTRATVMAAFAELARRRGMSVEQVEDSLSPTIALSEPRVKLDYGSRTIDVGFDERLDPFIESARGKLRKLPKAGKKDDPAKVARAAQIWDELLEDVTAIADLRLDSLERAMISGRSWTLDAFRKAWMDHPLMRHLARGVVWRAGGKSFRIAEDGTFADHEDAAFDTKDQAIGIVHPAEMQGDERDGWRRVFFDYRITQPLEQLDRRLLLRAEGASITLAPDVPPLPAESVNALRAIGFETTWRNREQIATRACTRTPHRMRVTQVVEDRKVVRYVIAAEQDAVDVGLENIHPVDLSEIVHALALHPT